MKKLFTYLLLCTLLISISTCKKYDEGGLTRLTLKHLFGGKSVGDSKTWKLDKYEVNGIDSTFLIQGAIGYPDFYEKFIVFTYTIAGDPSPGYEANTSVYKYRGRIGKVYKEMTINMNTLLSNLDSTQCGTFNNTSYCQRNIMYPSLLYFNSIWKILKLKKDELILSTTLSNSNEIKIILTH